ncbi:MAG: HDOD domain-containing protein [Phycisphaeraceae bacterium]
MSQAPSPAEQGQEQIVAAAVGEISSIATLPEITLQIIRLVEDPNSSAQDLNKVISHDPALGARILKVVNSAFYGLPGQIGSINRAIVLLGLNAVKNIAIAASLAKLFRGGQICAGFSARELWAHSIAVASATRLLAKHVNLNLPDEAFLAGLIHDIGIMVEVQARRPKFIEAMEKLDATPGLTFRAAEHATLGANHEQFGAGLCKAWKFPASFAYVTGHHHNPMELAAGHRTLACLVHVADVTAARLGLGYGRTVECTEIASDVLDSVGLTPARVEEVAAALPKAVEEAGAMLTDATAAAANAA